MTTTRTHRDGGLEPRPSRDGRQPRPVTRQQTIYAEGMKGCALCKVAIPDKGKDVCKECQKAWQEHLREEKASERAYQKARERRVREHEREQEKWRQKRREERLREEEAFRQRRETNPDRWYSWTHEERKQIFLPLGMLHPQYLHAKWEENDHSCTYSPREGIKLFYEAYFTQEAFEGCGRIFRIVRPDGDDIIFVVMEPKLESPWVEDPREHEIKKIKEAKGNE